MAANKKITLNLDVKTTFSNSQNAINKLKEELSKIKLGGTSKDAFSGIEKGFSSFEKQLTALQNFKLNADNVSQYASMVKQLDQTYASLEKQISDVAIAERASFNSEKKNLQELLALQNKKLQEAERNKAEKKAEVDALKNQTVDKNDVEAVKAKEEALKKAQRSYAAYSGVVTKAKKAIDETTSSIDKSSKAQFEESEQLKKSQAVLKQAEDSRNALNKSIKDAVEESLKLKQAETNEQISNQVKRWTSLAIVVQFARKQLRNVIETYKDLDSSLTQIAVVSGKTRDDMWGMIGTYNEMAQRLGTTTKEVVESSKLYFQQGRSQSEVMKLVEQTTVLASISQLDFTDATNFMTAAINGFKLSADDAIEVTDTWANLAAQAAVDTEELATAISKVASISQSAGMDINSTSAFLTKMIETTREAPENLGTALKTVIARFQELKTSTEDLGDGVDANKVEKALKKADAALRDTSGQFRDFDDVIMELSSKWDGLDRNTQRYIATIAAGSRLNVNRLQLAA